MPASFQRWTLVYNVGKDQEDAKIAANKVDLMMSKDSDGKPENFYRKDGLGALHADMDAESLGSLRKAMENLADTEDAGETYMNAHLEQGLRPYMRIKAKIDSVRSMLTPFQTLETYWWLKWVLENKHQVHIKFTSKHGSKESKPVKMDVSTDNVPEQKIKKHKAVYDDDMKKTLHVWVETGKEIVIPVAEWEELSSSIA